MSPENKRESQIRAQIYREVEAFAQSRVNARRDLLPFDAGKNIAFSFLADYYRDLAKIESEKLWIK